MSEINQNDRLLTVAEVATMTGYTEKTVRSAYLAGRLKAFQTEQVGSRVRVPLSAVYEWIGHSPAKSTEPPLEEQDWATPAEWADPNQDLTLCDPGTLYIPVHISRLSEFTDAKQRAGR